MDAYIYQAELWCSNCIAAIKCKLEKEGKNIETDDENDWDSDDYPKGPYLEGGGEADAPNHCAGCCVHLENPLTAEGEAYVVEAIGNKSHLSETEQVWADFYCLA